MLSGGSLLESARQSWALYISKWIAAYNKQLDKSLNIWGVTVQVLLHHCCLLTAHCLLLLPAACLLLLPAICSLLIAYRLLLLAACSLLTAYCCSPFTTGGYLLPVAVE